jgi:glutathione S-transferase
MGIEGIEIFWSSGSPFSWRVLLALEAKRLPYQSRLLEMSRREHKTPDYLAMNPRGQVPTLRDGDYAIYESIAILAYLDRKYPEIPLFGVTAQETGTIWRVVCEVTNYLDQTTDDFILPLYQGRAEADADKVRAVLPPIQAELARHEATLRERAKVGAGWLATPTMSAADIVLFPLVMSLLRAAGKPAAAAFAHGLTPFGDKYPALAAWVARVEATPGYERTYPPHWR